MLKIVINCGRCEAFIGRCLDSVKRQTYRDWQAFVTADRRGDATYERAIAASDGDARIHVTQNERRLYPMRNIVRAIERSGAVAEDVIVILDGDDWLIDDDAFARIAAAYEERGCWMTYGSWISNQDGHPGRWPAYADGTVDFRGERWLATAMRTWKKWLFDLIDPADFRDERGRWLRVSEDLACMFPMLEMATTRRAHHIAEPLMLYNRLSHHDPKRRLAEEGIRNAAWLRTKPRYAPLSFTNGADESSLQTEVRFSA